MEENETKVIDETIEDSNEETQEEVNEVEETTDEPNSDDDSSSPTLEDYEKLRKETETLKAQKEHWRKKVEKLSSKKEETKETNQEQLSESALLELSRLAPKYSDEDIQLLKEIKTLKGLKSLGEAEQTQFFQASIEQKQAEEKKRKAQLPASKGGARFIKDDSSPDELKKVWLGK